MPKGKLNGMYKHGMSTDKFYWIWAKMKQRCVDKNDISYFNYGGRGIVCEWDNFLSFKKDMYESYLVHLKRFGVGNTSLDRINTNGNYSRKNCRWATYRQQSSNTRRNRVFTFNGKTMIAQDWARKIGVQRQTIIARIDKLGWSIARALTTKHAYR